MTYAPVSSGRSWASEPLKARPTGVRTLSTITASGIERVSLAAVARGPKPYGTRISFTCGDAA